MKKILVGMVVCLGVFTNGNCMQKGCTEVEERGLDFFQRQWNLRRAEELKESDSELRLFRELIRKDSLGASGLGKQILNLSKILKDKKGDKYDIARSVYVGFMFADYGDDSDVNDAISVFLDLIRTSSDDGFLNPLDSERIKWADVNLKLNLDLRVDELRSLRLEPSKEAEYARRERLLRKNLSKVFIDGITSVDDFSSSYDSSED